MSSGKRKPQGSVGRQGGDATKKVKTNEGRDIPSSNFQSAKAKQAPKYGQIKPSMITSVTSGRTLAVNPDVVLRKMELPGVIRDAMGPNLAELKEYAKKKAKQQALSQNRVDKAKIPMLEKQKQEAAEEKANRPKEIIQDESGRIRDEKGNIINLKPINASSLKININKAKEEKVKELLKLQRGTGLTANRNSKLFDPTLLSKSQTLRNKRKNNAFHFIEKGSILKKAEAMRSQVGDDGQTPEIATENGTLNKIQAIGQPGTGANEVQVGIRRVGVRVKRHDPVPDVEWWDAPLLPPNRRSYLPEENLVQEKEMSQKEKYEKGEEKDSTQDGKAENDAAKTESLIARLNKNLESLKNDEFAHEILQKEKINNMVEHPATFKSDGSAQNVVIPTYLTKDERKKLRRKKRLEREKDKQEKIRLGLIKPPPPKIKYSNFMNIMKDEAVADPTRVEMEVRKATQERLQQHLDRNAKRKLTRDQKADKNMRKLRRDSALECRVAVFRVEDLSHGAHKFKVTMNAQQLALNGVCIIVDKKLGLNLPNVVVVEGGPKAIKFYKKLMLRRVKWNLRSQKGPAPTGDEEVDKSKQAFPENKCSLVWEGVLKDHNFNKWRVAEIKSEMEGRRLLADRGVEFYWDRALTNTEIADEDAD